MTRVRVKICGITSASDAAAAVDAGADALGFVLWKGSPRAVTAEALPGLTRDLPPYVARVGVFVDAPPAQIEAVASGARLTAAQLCGSESVEFCQALALPWYRVFRIDPAASAAMLVATIRSYGAPAFMLDAGSAGRPGGTGETLDWRAAAKVSIGAAFAGTPRLILAGGLTPENVAEAIAVVRPWAVDVSSGVESAPGRKDPDRMRAFVDAVRSRA